MDPINYMLDVKNPIEEAIRGYTMGRNEIAQQQEMQIQRQNATMEQQAFEDQQRALQAQRAASDKAVADAQAGQAELARLAGLGAAATADDYMKAWVANPAIRDDLNNLKTMITEPQSAALLQTTQNMYATTASGNIEATRNILQTQLDAAMNSGDQQMVPAYRAALDQLDQDPEGAMAQLKTTSAMTLMGLKGPEYIKMINESLGLTPAKPTEAMRTQDAQLRAAGIVPKNEGGDGQYEAAMEKAGGVPEDPTQFRDATAEELKRYNAVAGQINIKTGKFEPTGDKGPLVTNILGDAEGTFAKELAKGDAARIMATIDAGQSAARNLVELDSLSDLLGKVDTGGAAAAKAWLGTFGVDTEGLDDIQAFEAVIARMVPAQRVEGSGSSSNLDVQQFVKGLPSLMKQPGGNQIIVETLRDINEYDVAASIIAGQVAEWAQTPAADRKALEEQGLILSPAKGRKAILDLGSPTAAYKASLKQKPTTTTMPAQTVTKQEFFDRPEVQKLSPATREVAWTEYQKMTAGQ